MRSILLISVLLVLIHVGFADAAWFDSQVLYNSGPDPHSNYRIPSLLVSEQGTLLAFAEGRSGGDLSNVDLVAKRSFDGGDTWEAIQTVRDDGLHTVGNPTPVVDRGTGDILMIHNRNDEAATEASIINGIHQREVWITRSSDDGATWSAPIDLTASVNPPNTAWHSVGPGVSTQLASGRLVVPSLRTEIGVPFTNPGVWKSYAAYSDDGGTTWQHNSPQSGFETQDADENQIVELEDGRLMMMARRPWTIADQHYRVSYSDDQGETWSASQAHPDLPTWGSQGSVIRYTSSDEFAQSRLLFSGPASLTDRSRMTVYMSYDEGATWSVSKEIDAGYGGYSSLTVLPDKSIGLLYETAGANELTLARFDLDWLTDGADQLVPFSVGWNTDGVGSWSEPNNWFLSLVPDSNIITADFGSAITSPASVIVDTAVSVKNIQFNNLNSYAIIGIGNVSLEADTGNAYIDVLQGSHQFQAVVNLNSSTDVDVATDAQLVFNNTLNLNGNDLIKTGDGVMSINNTLNTGGGTVIVSGGAVTGSGQIKGNVDNISATVAPGNSPGTLAIAGDYTHGGDATLSIEIAGLAQGSQYDVLDISGLATIEGGTLEVMLIDSFSPSEGDRFHILDFASTDGMGFEVLKLAPLNSGLSWDASQLLINGTLSVTVVPEPTSALLLSVAMFTLLGQSRRRCRHERFVQQLFDKKPSSNLK